MAAKKSWGGGWAYKECKLLGKDVSQSFSVLPSWMKWVWLLKRQLCHLVRILSLHLALDLWSPKWSSTTLQACVTWFTFKVTAASVSHALLFLRIHAGCSRLACCVTTGEPWRHLRSGCPVISAPQTNGQIPYWAIHQAHRYVSSQTRSLHWSK